MNTHAPGPWEVFGVAQTQSRAGYYMIADAATGERVAESGWKAANLADANLIAAAPEMLDALRYVQKMILSGQEFGLSKINAAIRKAEGKS